MFLLQIYLTKYTCCLKPDSSALSGLHPMSHLGRTKSNHQLPKRPEKEQFTRKKMYIWTRIAYPRSYEPVARFDGKSTHWSGNIFFLLGKPEISLLMIRDILSDLKTDTNSGAVQIIAKINLSNFDISKLTILQVLAE